MRYVTVGKSHFERKKERKKIGLIFKFLHQTGTSQVI